MPQNRSAAKFLKWAGQVGRQARPPATQGLGFKSPERPVISRLRGGDFAVCFAIMFEKIKVQLPAAEEKVAHLRRFL
jgi:hypothetical protein